jgi:hypothetical protein
MSATARPARWDPTARGGAGGWVADADPDVPGPPAGPAPSEVAGTGSMTVPPRPARPPPRPATAPARPASPPPSAAPPPPPQAAAPSVMSGPASGSAGRGYDAPLVAGPDRGYDAPTGARFLPPEHEQQAAAATPHRRRMGALISAAVALLLVAGAAVVLLVVRPFDHKAGRPSAAGAVTPQTTAPAAAPQVTQPGASAPSVSTQAAAVDVLLAGSAASRPGVAAAVADAQNCGNLRVDQQTLLGAAAARQGLLDDLSGLPVDKMPDGTAAALGYLRTAWQSSKASDQSYAAWVGDLLNYGCPAKSDPNFAAAQQTDATATNAKTSFVQTWNPIAAPLGLPSRDQARL